MAIIAGGMVSSGAARSECSCGKTDCVRSSLPGRWIRTTGGASPASPCSWSAAHGMPGVHVKRADNSVQTPAVPIASHAPFADDRACIPARTIPKPNRYCCVQG